MPTASLGTTVSSAAAEVDSLEMRTLNVSSNTAADPIASAVQTKLASTDSACRPANADQMRYAMFEITNRSANVHQDTAETADWDVVHPAIRAILIHVA